MRTGTKPTASARCAMPGKTVRCEEPFAWFEKLQKFCSRVEWNTIPRTTVLFNRKQFVEGLRDGRVGVFDESGGKNDPKDMVVLMTGEAIERYIRQNPSVSAQSKVLMLQERLMGKVEDEFFRKGHQLYLRRKKRQSAAQCVKGSAQGNGKNPFMRCIMIS